MSIERVSAKDQERRELRRQQRAAVKSLIRDDRMANREEYWAKRFMLGYAGLMIGVVLAAPVAIFIPGGFELGLQWIPAAGSLALLPKLDRIIYLTRLSDSESGLN